MHLTHGVVGPPICIRAKCDGRVVVVLDGWSLDHLHDEVVHVVSMCQMCFMKFPSSWNLQCLQGFIHVVVCMIGR